MLNPNLPHLNGHGVAEPPASAALLESALDVLVDHTFATSLTCLIFLCVALELVRYWRAEEEKRRRAEFFAQHRMACLAVHHLEELSTRISLIQFTEVSSYAPS